MSKKEALSQFQTRLADLLQSAQGTARADSANWLAVEIAEARFMFPLEDSGEIFPWLEPQPIPYTKDWFLGVSNLRGSLCGVVSLAQYFDMPISAEIPGTTKSLQDRRLIGFHPSLELNTVLAVDRLAGLKSRQQMTGTQVANQYLDPQGMLWQEIDLRTLAQDPAFISIAQSFESH
jgi:twitching motility protein PilI